MVNLCRVDYEACQHYPTVLEDRVGCLPGELHLDLNANTVPVQMTARRVPVAMKEPLRTELQRLESLGFLQEIDEPTEWTSPMIVARKRDGSMRVCIDPQARNTGLRRSTHPVPTVDELLPELTNAKVFSKCDVRHGF